MRLAISVSVFQRAVLPVGGGLHAIVRMIGVIGIRVVVDIIAIVIGIVVGNEGIIMTTDVRIMVGGNGSVI